MTISEAERQRVIAEHDQQKKVELSARMSALGRSRSPKKLRAAQANIQKALEKKYGKKFRRKKVAAK